MKGADLMDKGLFAPNSLLAALVCTSLIVSFGLTKLVLNYTRKKNILDIPNERSSHKTPTPRGGGIAIVVTFIAACSLLLALNFTLTHAVLMFCVTGIASLGWSDDRITLSAHLRLVIQAVLGLLLIGSFWNQLPQIYQEWWGPKIPNAILGLISLLGIVWLTNLYNFMDGIDGIASLQCVTVCIASAFLSWNSPDVAALFLILATSTLGFLVWNWSPAKIFMGDVGSAALGFALCGLLFAAASTGALSLTESLILHSAFVVDATYTLVRRSQRRLNVAEAHRSHTYQHATQSGWSHSQVSTAYGLVNLLWLLPLAICTRNWPNFGPMFLLIAVTPLILAARHFRAGEQISAENLTT